MLFSSLRTSKVFMKILVSYLFILTIPVFLGSVSYLKASRVVEEETDLYNQAMLGQVREVIDNRLKDVEQLALHIASNAEIVDYLNDGDNVNNHKDEIKVLNQLYNYKNLNQFIYDFYLFSDVNNFVISPGGKWDPNFFFEHVYRYKGIDADKMRTLLLKYYYDKVYWPRREVFVGKWPEQIITYIKPIIYNSNNRIGNLSILISEQNIVDMLQDMQVASKGSVYVIDGNGNIIASTEKNQDITEFNKLALLGRYGSIKGNINGTESVVAYTTSYVTDWKYISVIPTSVVLSKVDYIKNITIELTAVLLIIGLILAYFFAYMNYDPIKQLLRWIKDHISITGDDKYGNEFEFIRLTLSNTYDESIKIKSELLRQKPILKANIMYRLLKGSIENRDIDELKDYLDISFDSDYFAVVIYQINHGGKLIKEGNAKEWVLTRFTVSKIIDEVADKYVNSFVVELDKDTLAEIVNFRVDDIDECRKELLDIVTFSKDFIEHHYEILLSVGVGRIYKGIENVNISYNDAVAACDYKIVMGKGKIINYEDVKENNKNYFYPLDVEQQLVNSVKVGDKRNVEKLLSRLFDENFNNRRLPYKLVQCLFFDIMSTAIKTLDEIKIDYKEVFYEEFDPISHLLTCDNAKDMYDELNRIYTIICNYIQHNRRSHNRILLDKIINYVNNNYSDENLCVQRIAEYYNMNPSYISYFFKEQTGENLNDYITRIRIEKAKEYMNDVNMSLSEIAAKVGLGSDNRLIRLFKKEMGITPGRYRSSLQSKIIET